MKRKQRIIISNDTWVENHNETTTENPYASWLETQQREPVSANPDTLEDTGRNKFWGTNTPPQLIELFIERFTDDKGSFPSLSRRQNQVLRLRLLGLSITEISKELHLKEHRVKVYLQRVRYKFKRLIKTLETFENTVSTEKVLKYNVKS